MFLLYKKFLSTKTRSDIYYICHIILYNIFFPLSYRRRRMNYSRAKMIPQSYNITIQNLHVAYRLDIDPVLASRIYY